MDPALIFVGLTFAGLATLATVKALGPTLTEPTELDEDGVVCVRDQDGRLVQADPEALARGAGVTADAYALARVMASEAGELPELAQVGVAWTVRNHSSDRGRSVLRVVTAASFKSGADAVGDGFFGRQGGPGGYRYVASSQDTSSRQRELAKQIMSGELDDPTGGALNFDSPNAYGVQAGTEESGADNFASNREAEGKELVTLPGIPETQIRFWRPT